jgi:Glycosyl hydrolases family 35
MTSGKSRCSRVYPYRSGGRFVCHSPTRAVCVRGVGSRWPAVLPVRRSEHGSAEWRRNLSGADETMVAATRQGSRSPTEHAWGTIIAVQVENEYGSFGNDKDYMKSILAALRSAGLGEALLYTADGGNELQAGTLPEIHAVVNFGPGEAKEEFAKLQKFRPGARCCAESIGTDGSIRSATLFWAPAAGERERRGSRGIRWDASGIWGRSRLCMCPLRGCEKGPTMSLSLPRTSQRVGAFADCKRRCWMR